MEDGSPQTTWAILVAAGTGERLGGDRPKAFAALAGRPLLAETIERLDTSDWIDAIVVAAPPGWEEPAILLAEELVASKVVAVVTGGRTRAESVRIGLAEVSDDANSQLIDPLFLSTTDLHLQAGSPILNDGTPIAGVTTDFDGQTRDATPDVGADEIPVVAVPGSLQFSSATSSVGEAGGTATLTSARICASTTANASLAQSRSRRAPGIRMRRVNSQ